MDRVAAPETPVGGRGGKSGLLRAGCWVTPRLSQGMSPTRKTESGTETYRCEGIVFLGVRVKSGGKGARPTAVTQRRSNPTWSKAK